MYYLPEWMVLIYYQVRKASCREIYIIFIKTNINYKTLYVCNHILYTFSSLEKGAKR